MKRATFVSTASGDSLCSDLLEKLANFLCWEYTEYRCKKPGTNLWFYMWGLRPGTYSVFSGNPSNGAVTNIGYVTGGSKIEVIERDGTAVVSFFN